MERPLVVIELTDALAKEIANGGVFVPGCTLKLSEECALVVSGSAEEIELAARVVYVDPSTGAGLELVGFSPALRQHLANVFETWLAAPPPAPALPAEAEPDPDAPAADVEVELSEEEAADPEQRTRALTLHERMRGLSMSQQIKIAQTGDQQERIVLERYYNKNVWEPLLRNPKLTAPEVARIARMGTLPRILLEQIVNNGAWLQVPEVRRALLANPRLGTDQILRVLRMLPKHELKLAAVQTAYPYAVRDCAKRVIKEQGGNT